MYVCIYCITRTLNSVSMKLQLQASSRPQTILEVQMLADLFSDYSITVTLGSHQYQLHISYNLYDQYRHPFC